MMEKCPRCPNEELVKAIGNLLICPSCDVIYIEKQSVNDLVGKVEVIDTPEH